MLYFAAEAREDVGWIEEPKGILFPALGKMPLVEPLLDVNYREMMERISVMQEEKSETELMEEKKVI